MHMAFMYIKSSQSFVSTPLVHLHCSGQEPFGVAADPRVVCPVRKLLVYQRGMQMANMRGSDSDKRDSDMHVSIYRRVCIYVYVYIYVCMDLDLSLTTEL